MDEGETRLGIILARWLSVDSKYIEETFGIPRQAFLRGPAIPPAAMQPFLGALQRVRAVMKFPVNVPREQINGVHTGRGDGRRRLSMILFC